MTGLMGRWQTISKNPLTICDTGHNVGGMQYIIRQLDEIQNSKLKIKSDRKARLHIVFGCCHDKDVSTVLSMLPKDAVYYFTQASVQRAMLVEDFSEIAGKHQLCGRCFKDVESAYNAAKQNADTDDLIFIGGSTFVVADLLKALS
jgi:dihydrofolate synthase/folylpolyglutamate synthase